MRKLPIPTIEDADRIDGLGKAGKHKLAVSQRAAQIKVRYDEYRHVQGNPWKIAEDNTFDDLRLSLNHLYNSPPKGFEFIGEMRREVVGACPVCGRDSLGTLDHYLPKQSYSEFSIFSLNLVPACDRCNTVRKTLVRGNVQDERPIHPYFDDFLDQRIMTVLAEPDWSAPRLRPIPYNVQGETEQVVAWHIENIILPAGIEPYLINLWTTLVSKPSLYLGIVANEDHVRAQLERLAEMEATLCHSPNAWRSSFYHGLQQNDGAVEYLTNLIVI
ncbi:hypothetical protein [Duganella sp. S19_KUP01_CR8]|uniref:hypothetical protein n=1 Tax=Duganella sp. S19_KUP01_CR8 TaxID=3025502 RepID=UPI002FCD9394